MRTLTMRLLPGTIFPLTFILSIGCYAWLLHQGINLIVATYSSLSIALFSVLLFERVLPYRQEWKADRREQGQDFLFIALIHMLFTKFLAFAAALLILHSLDGRHLPFPPWPRHWPIFFQGMLMVLCVDFFRYWLHRACHQNTHLWRLHAVHHSPKRLYWLNVGRFHPAERTLQFLLDSIPFMLLGVPKEVLALYFLFFAVNGFFQHCNIRLHYGFLNYLFSSAELHRWHHSKIPSESNTNFSNTTIVWDLVFGTRFLPSNKSVGELGLTNDQYPVDFASQMKTPFIAGIENRDLPFISWRDVFLNGLLTLKMAALRIILFQPLAKAAQNPGRAQNTLLLNILKRNRGTAFGKKHGFSEIRNVTEFREKVPVQTYEDLRPYIEEQEKTGKPMLTRDAPVLYHQTSGTTGAPKYIPLLPSALKRIHASQKLFASIEHRFHPAGFQGKMLGLVSPAVEGRLSSGLPYGSASGLAYRNMPKLARAKYALPYEVFEIPDPEAKYYLILRLALAEKLLTHIGSANPSTFFKLLDVVAVRGPDLVEDIRTGRAKYLEQLEPHIAGAIAARIKPQPDRAAELERILQGQRIDFGSLWPYLTLVTTWTGGSCGMAVSKLKSKLPPGTRIFELGYLSSEFRGTITVDGITGEGVPTLQDHFFEFVEKAAWESGKPGFLGIENLERGMEYYVFITTPSGLYRYAMNDIVQAVGHFMNTPTLRFLQKGKGVTNITGEKLYESQLIQAVKSIESETGMETQFFQMLADEGNFRYLLYLEADFSGGMPADIASILDRRLQDLNLEYKAKRAGNRLKPLEFHRLKTGTFEAYQRHFLAKGQREMQFKPSPLLYLKTLDFDLESWRSNP